MPQDFTIPPIEVNATPGRDQAEALLRQVIAALALIVAAFGAAKWAGQLNLLATLAGPIVTVAFGVVGIGAILWGQIKTRILSQKAAAMANMLPDRVAVTKP
jgi:hypothetical protein